MKVGKEVWELSLALHPSGLSVLIYKMGMILENL